MIRARVTADNGGISVEFDAGMFFAQLSPTELGQFLETKLRDSHASDEIALSCHRQPNVAAFFEALSETHGGFEVQIDFYDLQRYALRRSEGEPFGQSR